MSGTGPTVGHFYAFLPDIPEVLLARGLAPAALAGGGPLRARAGLTAADDMAGLRWLPDIFFDAYLPGQRPAPGQQGPQAPPTGTVPGAGAALGSGASEPKPYLLLFAPTVQAAVRAPGGQAAEPTASVFEHEVLGLGAPGSGRDPGAKRGPVPPAGPGRLGLSGQPGPGPEALLVQELTGLSILLGYFGDTEKLLTALSLLGTLGQLQESTFCGPILRALLKGVVC